MNIEEVNTTIDIDETLSEKRLLFQCVQHGGYRTPELNETLYLNHCRITHINKALLPYSNCRVLYLNNNALSDISALASMGNLTSLYLSCNAIRHVKSLPTLPSLQLLDLSENNLVDLAGLAAAVPRLQVLQAGRNRLTSLAGAGLDLLADTLTTLDLSHNLMTTVEVVQPVLKRLGGLRTLVLNGNALVRTVSAYRKRFIALLPELRSLDGMPIFPQERERAHAFVKGGAELEQEVVVALRERDRQDKQEQMQFFEEVRKVPQMRRMLHGPKTEDSRYRQEQDAAKEERKEAMAVQDTEDLADVYVPPNASSH